MKQKESSGAVTVPGRTQDNGELNGVLNGKSSVFSHRFNVIAALTLLRSAISFAAVSTSCVSSLLCFAFLPPPPLCTPKFHTSPLSLQSVFPFPLSAFLPLCPHHGPYRPSGCLTYHGQFSASCSQLAIWFCNVSVFPHTVSFSAKHSERLSLGCPH